MRKEAIKELRQKSELTLRELAEKVGIDVKNLQRIECGATVPKVTTLEAILEAMGYELLISKKQTV